MENFRTPKKEHDKKLFNPITWNLAISHFL